MGKDNTLLYVVGGAAVLYFLLRSKGAEAKDGGGLLPDINLQMPEIKFPEIKIPDIYMPEIQLPNVEVNIPSISEMLGAGGEAEPAPEPPSPAVIADEAEPLLDLGDIRQKAGTIAGVGTGVVTAVGTSRVIPIATRGLTTTLTRIAPRIATTGAAKTALKFVPVVGWAYLAADVGATIYELVSGKSIGGDWLGWGEMIREIF